MALAFSGRKDQSIATNFSVDGAVKHRPQKEHSIAIGIKSGVNGRLSRAFYKCSGRRKHCCQLQGL